VRLLDAVESTSSLKRLAASELIAKSLSTIAAISPYVLTAGPTSCLARATSPLRAAARAASRWAMYPG
jgi:hypothetical protein